jgi:hypothetical protein
MKQRSRLVVVLLIVAMMVGGGVGVFYLGRSTQPAGTAASTPALAPTRATTTPVQLTKPPKTARWVIANSGLIGDPGNEYALWNVAFTDAQHGWAVGAYAPWSRSCAPIE